jgi:hypothetical protein
MGFLGNLSEIKYFEIMLTIVYYRKRLVHPDSILVEYDVFIFETQIEGDGKKRELGYRRIAYAISEYFGEI